jgi:hypothetical protein
MLAKAVLFFIGPFSLATIVIAVGIRFGTLDHYLGMVYILPLTYLIYYLILREVKPVRRS